MRGLFQRMCRRGCSPHYRSTFLLEAGKVPAIGKIAALPGLDLLNDTLAAAQEDALVPATDNRPCNAGIRRGPAWF